MVCGFCTNFGTCHEIAGKGVVLFEKMDSHSLSRVFSDQSKFADAHFLACFGC